VATRLRLATRGSPLARWQAGHVADLLAAHGVESELVVVDTTGDVRRDVPIAQLGGQGIFVKEVEAAVLEGRADAAVHSAKDLQSTTAEGLVLAAVPRREDPRDALVGRSLADLGPGATVATGSVRRRAQLAWLRPDLTFVGLRGNMDTRVGKVDQPGGPAAVVVAAAALLRLGWADRIAEYLEPAVMIPQVAQGALAVECRADDERVRAWLGAIEDEPSRQAVDAERGFLAELGGGCDLPVGAIGSRPTGPGGPLRLTGLLCSFDGRVRLVAARDSERGAAGAAAADAAAAAAAAAGAAALGRSVARHLLDEAGGRALMAELAPTP
jgi:hydroxymethylbilane synthase